MPIQVQWKIYLICVLSERNMCGDIYVNNFDYVRHIRIVLSILIYKWHLMIHTNTRIYKLQIEDVVITKDQELLQQCHFYDGMLVKK